MLILLLLAWHFSIQAAAYQTTLLQVRTWMKEMGATAGEVQFRLLRGALTIRDIKADIQGAPFTIQYLFIKGNPASITSDKPKLQRIDVENLTWDAQSLSQSWQGLNLKLPTSLQAIFYHARTIHFHHGNIIHMIGLPDLNLQQAQISGTSKLRELNGQGTILNSSGIWNIRSLFPISAAKPSGMLSINDLGHDIQLKWSGNSEDLGFSYKHTFENTSILALLNKQQAQWSGKVQLKLWPLYTTQLNSTLTGQINVSGTSTAWKLKSNKLHWKNTQLSNNLYIEDILSRGLSINYADKTFQAMRLDITGAKVALYAGKLIIPKFGWQLSLPNINIKKLESRIFVQQDPLHLPAFSGTAALDNNILTFDISNPVNETQFWRIQGQNNGRVQVYASDVPLRQLRNILPYPIQQQAFEVSGNTSLALDIIPAHNWETSGIAFVTSLALSSKNQAFLAEQFQIDIQHADQTGVQQASILAEQWQMQFPLTPRQAWSEQSHLDEWVKIPWSFESIQFNNGKISIGNTEQAWIEQANIQGHHWQSKQDTTLELSGNIGLSSISAHLTLQRNKDNLMQWKDLNLETKHTNIFMFNDWLRISQLPQVERGLLSIKLHAQQTDSYTHGKISIQANKLQFIETPNDNDYIQQQFSQPAQRVVEQLSQQDKVILNTTFQTTSDWSTSAVQSLLTKAQQQLNNSTPKQHKQKYSPSILGSLRIHQSNNHLSLNERTRLRKLIKQIKIYKKAYIELVPDFGTAELTPILTKQMLYTQSLIKSFLSRRGIKTDHIYAILPQDKHHSSSDASAIHIVLVK